MATGVLGVSFGVLARQLGWGVVAPVVCSVVVMSGSAQFAAAFPERVSALVLGGCLGPKPVLQSYQAEPPQSPDQPFRVEAVVHNAGPGEGEVLVEVSLTNKQTGAILRREEQHIALQTDETEHVLFELNLPPSAQDLPSDQIDVKVEAHYPIS